MDNINNRVSTTGTIDQQLLQPRLILQAIAFTAILYFCAGQTPPNPSSRVISQSVQSPPPLSDAVSHSVLRHASQLSGLPTSALRVIDAKPQTWSDNCLGLSESEVSCIQTPVLGWQVAVASEQKRWIYRTNISGSIIKLERGISLPKKESKEVALFGH
jgi:hypothetical protein